MYLPFVTALSLGRVALGLAPFLFAGPTSRLLGFPADQDSPTARLMGRLFGVRDIGLGVLGAYALGHPDAAAFLLLFNAATDAGDLVAISIPLVGRHGIDRAALLSGGMALMASTCWLIAWTMIPA